MSVFQNLILRSILPPPVASPFDYHGHHANALTAAEWPKQFYRNFINLLSQIKTILSLAPEAKD